MYAGEYKDLLRDGLGSFVFPGGYFHYSGQWRRGKMHGQGEFKLGDGTTYEGEFRDGEIEGVGLKRWPDGSSYNGHFHQGELHGEGVFLSASGERYEGHWENNQRCGHGRLRYPTGDLYSGDFAAHLPNGFGKIFYAGTGHAYEGEWLAGARCGIGVLHDANGNCLYEGHWSDDRRHGDGVGVLLVKNIDAEHSNELRYEGRWKSDEPEAQTTNICVKIISNHNESRPATASGNKETIPDSGLSDLPTQLVVTDKRLPTLAAVCTNQHTISGDAVRVLGENGRRFRLRIFEGTIPVHAPGEVINIAAGLAWQFAVSGPKSDDSSQPSESELVPPKLVSTEAQELTESPTEIRLDTVIAEASAGLAVFHDVSLPAATLIGDYYLLCESMTSDSLAPVLIPLSVK
ncbi:unnamed protein product [Phytophthora fragariaefolia]|uniref:Unnamed protein product n=1 Tax=Phytophthora fragariaefolia TaxID=1490495 RepID=A0A9W6Y1J3_9STRA|nr:unnamed protein product [Phytophthora fragariaefolia]